MDDDAVDAAIASRIAATRAAAEARDRSRAEREAATEAAQAAEAARARAKAEVASADAAQRGNARSRLAPIALRHVIDAGIPPTATAPQSWFDVLRKRPQVPRYWRLAQRTVRTLVPGEPGWKGEGPLSDTWRHETQELLLHPSCSFTDRIGLTETTLIEVIGDFIATGTPVQLPTVERRDV